MTSHYEPLFHMIESHYGHVNTIKHTDRVLQGMAGWELSATDDINAQGVESVRGRRLPYRLSLCEDVNEVERSICSAKKYTSAPSYKTNPTMKSTTCLYSGNL